MSGNNVTKRIDKLEEHAENIGFKVSSLQETLDRISLSTEMSAKSQKSVAKSIEKLTDTMIEFKKFEAKVDERRQAEKEIRLNIQDEMKELRDKTDKTLNTLFKTVRDVDKKLEVKTAKEEVKQSYLQKGFDIRGDRIFKALFWLGTFLAVSYMAFLKDHH